MVSSHPIYRQLFRSYLSQLDPEVAHARAARAIGRAGTSTPVRGFITATFGRTGRAGRAGVQAFGRHMRSPLGVAAGLDKHAELVPGLLALGFGFVEVGTITAWPQEGNAQPRLWRSLEQRALVNRMGFNNLGSEAVARRLAALRRTTYGANAVVGVNIGKSRITPLEDAAEDYAISARALAPYADYLVVNVSSPNTPGLRELHAVEQLRGILTATQEAADAAANRRVPVLVKLSPDASDEELREICHLVTELDLAGVVAVNTTVNHDHEMPGGLSGPPLHLRALEVVRLAREELGPDRLVIGAGGVSDAASARRMRDAGADLVQAYTAFVYHGPAWPGAVARELNGDVRGDHLDASPTVPLVSSETDPA